MAGPLATAGVLIRPVFTGFSSELSKGLGGHGRTAVKGGEQIGTQVGQGVHTGLRSALVGVGKVLAGAFAVKIGVDILSGFITDAREAARVGRITAATIQATGGAANITAKQVDALARSMMLKTGADDETIQAGMNMLLTFRNVRNEVGKGNDIFNRASADLLDMSAALNGGDLSAESLRKTAIQLGVALNDPAAGLTRLRRMGVTFTKTQQDMIKGWVEHGQVLRAQKYILKEVEREFGGTAAAAADPIQRLKQMFKEVGESIGTWLLGPLTKAVNYLTNTAIPAISNWWKQVAGPKVTATASTIGQAFKALFGGQTTPGKQPPPAAGGGARPGDIGGPGAVGVTTGGARPGDVYKPPAPAWQAFLVHVRAVVVEVGTKLWPVLQKVFTFVGQVWGTLVKVGKAMLPAWRDVWTFVKQLWNAVQSLWKAFAPIAGPILKVALGVIVIAFRLIAWVLAHVVGPAIMGFSTAVKNVVGWIRTGWKKMTDFLASAWSAAVHGLRVVFAAVVNFILGLFGSLLHAAVVAFGWIPGLGGKLRAAEKQFGTFRDNVNKSILGIKDKKVNVNVQMTAANNPYGGGGLTGRGATGGQVYGPGTGTSDTAGVFALSRGEWVVKAASAAKYGPKAMASVNKGTAVIIPGMATGGQVTIHPSMPSEPVIRATLDKPVIALAKAFADGFMNLFSGGGPGGGGGAGVARWTGLVQQVLRLLGQALSWTGLVLRRMNQESGGNPRAVNLWDINAQRGDPSRGLMQTIGATFNAYAGPYRSRGIFDPFANIYAALRYTLARYGTLAALGQPGGYAQGTLNAARGWGLVGERGPELVWFRGGEKVLPTVQPLGGGVRRPPGTTTGPAQFTGLEARLDRVIILLERHPALIGAAVADGVNGIGRSTRQAMWRG
jgi:SLT domain-containing protein